MKDFSKISNADLKHIHEKLKDQINFYDNEKNKLEEQNERRNPGPTR